MYLISLCSNKNVAIKLSGLFYLISFFNRSGTGKSTLLKQLVASCSASGKIKKLYLVNVGAAETVIYRELFTEVAVMQEFEQISKTEPHSLILVEDIINMTKNDEKVLRRGLNYDAHHKSQNFFCVSHSIYKTSIWSMLSFFHFIIFTSAVSNIPVIRFTLNYFKIEKAQLNFWLDKFKVLGRGGQKGIYFYFDCVKMTFNVSEDTNFKKLKKIGTAGIAETENPEKNSLAKENPASSPPASLQQKFDLFIEGFSHQTQASAIFSILVGCIKPALIRTSDLSFAFKTGKQQNQLEVRLSVVDYITTLLTPKMPASQPLKAFHNYVQKRCNIPQIFILNKSF